MNCCRCGRTLKRPPLMVDNQPFGPICARASFGTKPKRMKAEPVRDPLTPDLFDSAMFPENAEVRGRVLSILQGVSLEMPA